MLANRMIVPQMRECGKQNIRGDDFKDFNPVSNPTLHVLPLAFAEAVIGEDRSSGGDTYDIRVVHVGPCRTEDAC
jgi:hypothetical protein